jgi:archaellum component FlaC
MDTCSGSAANDSWLGRCARIEDTLSKVIQALESIVDSVSEKAIPPQGGEKQTNSLAEKLDASFRRLNNKANRVSELASQVSSKF